MALQNFLYDEKLSFQIAKVAIAFQATVAFLILFSLASSPSVLVWLLYIDVVFVLLHVSYRAAYRGPKVILIKKERIVLLFHIASSILALGLTFCMLYRLQVDTRIIFVFWIVSLISGIIFFRQKYGEKFHLE